MKILLGYIIIGYRTDNDQPEKVIKRIIETKEEAKLIYDALTFFDYKKIPSELTKEQLKKYLNYIDLEIKEIWVDV